MRTTTYIVLLCVTAFIFSCEKDGLMLTCKDCYLEEPEKATIMVKLNSISPKPGSYATRINVYDGNLEDSILIAYDIVPGDYWEFKAYFNKKYTFTATYVTSGNTYITVDASFPGVRFVKDQCEEPCYYVYGNKVNLKLKYPDL